MLLTARSGSPASSAARCVPRQIAAVPPVSYGGSRQSIETRASSRSWCLAYVAIESRPRDRNIPTASPDDPPLVVSVTTFAGRQPNHEPSFALARSAFARASSSTAASSRTSSPSAVARRRAIARTACQFDRSLRSSRHDGAAPAGRGPGRRTVRASRRCVGPAWSCRRSVSTTSRDPWARSPDRSRPLSPVAPRCGLDLVERSPQRERVALGAGEVLLERTRVRRERLHLL